MKKTEHSNLILQEMAENPQNGFEKALAQLPCMRMLKSSSPGTVGETPLSDWLDNQDVMQILHISPRTLQTLRSNGTLPFSRIGNKLFYRRQDIIKILSDNYTMHKIRNYGRDK